MQLFVPIVTRRLKTRMSLLKILFPTPGMGDIMAHLFLAHRLLVPCVGAAAII